MKSTLPGWEDGAWTNIMPSTSKAVSGCIKSPEPSLGVMSFVPCETKNTHFRSHGSYGVHLSEGLVYERSWGPCSVLVTAGLRGSRIERPQEFTLVRGQHFPGNFHAVPWTVPSQREQGHWGIEEGHVTQLRGSARYVFGESF